MARFDWILILGLALVGMTSAYGQKPATPAAPDAELREDASSLTAWQAYYEVRMPAGAVEKSPWLDFVLTPAVFDDARADLGDLRIYDGRDREVPFALRVRRNQDEQQALPAKSFNRQVSPDRSVQIDLDLGPNPSEHQEIDVMTKGENFRRRVELLGSDDRQKWGKLLENAWLIDYQVDSQKVDVHRLHYAAGRFRYLQVRVYPDLSQPEDKPDIASVTVYHTIRVPGEYVTRPVQLRPREAVRAYGAPASAWILDLGGDRVPVERLSFDVVDTEFSRPYVLEEITGGGTFMRVVSGDWRRRPEEQRNPLEIQLPREITAHRLRLVVMDHANAPLSVSSAQYTAPARQVVFARKGMAAPVRLYANNPKAEPPHYDFAANLPALLQPAPDRIDLGPREANPLYEPEPKPWTERWPWLVYVVLGTASAVLLAILGVLARKAVGRHDAEQEAA